MHNNEFKSADDFLYSASLDNIEMAIVFKSPEVREGAGPDLAMHLLQFIKVQMHVMPESWLVGIF